MKDTTIRNKEVKLVEAAKKSEIQSCPKVIRKEQEAYMMKVMYLIKVFDFKGLLEILPENFETNGGMNKYFFISVLADFKSEYDKVKENHIYFQYGKCNLSCCSMKGFEMFVFNGMNCRKSFALKIDLSESYIRKMTFCNFFRDYYGEFVGNSNPLYDIMKDKLEEFQKNRGIETETEKFKRTMDHIIKWGWLPFD